MKCLGCETVFYQFNSWDSEDWDNTIGPDGQPEIFHRVTIKTYPEPEKKGQMPDWVWQIDKIDPPLASILKQTYAAYETDALILASVGLRTAFDRATVFLKIDSGRTLADKVKSLLENGFIGETEAEILTVVVDAGSAAAHRGWSPGAMEFRELLVALEQFIHRNIVTGKSALDIAKKVPARPPRPPKAGSTN